MMKSVNTVTLSTLASLLFSLPVYAAEHAHHQASVSAITLPLINFTLYVVIMAWILKKPLATALRARRDNIDVHIKRAAMSWNQARTKLLEVQRRFSSIDSEISEISQRIDKDGRKEAELMVSEAKEKAAMIIKRAHENIEAETKSATNQIRAELAQAVIQKASEKLKKEITLESDAGLRARALEGLNAIN